MINKQIAIELCDLVVQIKQEFDHDTGSLAEIEKKVNELYPYAFEYLKFNKLPN